MTLRKKVEMLFFGYENDFLPFFKKYTTQILFIKITYIYKGAVEGAIFFL